LLFFSFISNLIFFLVHFLHEFPSHSRSWRRRGSHHCLAKPPKQQTGHAAQNQSPELKNPVLKANTHILRGSWFTQLLKPASWMYVEIGSTEKIQWIKKGNCGTEGEEKQEIVS